MSETEQNKAAISKLFEAMNEGDVETILNTYADDGYLHTMGRTLVSGKYTNEQSAGAAGHIFAIFPKGIKFTIIDMTAEGNRVAVEATSLGEHVSGKTYANEYHFLARFRNGKIVSFKEYMDTELATDILCAGQRPPAA